MQQLKPELNTLIQKEALELFYNNGYQATLMRDLADAVGMSVGNTYRYYKSKHDLFYSLVEPVYEKVKALLEATHEDDPRTHLNELYLTTILTRFTTICTKYHKEAVIFLEYYLAQDQEPVMSDIKKLIFSSFDAHFPGMKEGAKELVYHFIATGTVFILRKSPPEDLVTNLKALYIFLFKDINERV
ncbi:MAG: DNA-binding transcriptional repressor AcrR [Tenericutes bacterium ADurb.Bin239]|nr:MAG: DNA-binding transcriptional repressor AcrR [Tenericutes bacterium ADurb.Bin239]